MCSVFGNPKNAPPPLERLSPEAAVGFLWEGEGSFVEEVLQSIAPNVEEQLLNDFKSQMPTHDPSGSDDIWKELEGLLLWLRDEVRNLPSTCTSKLNAAADLINIYACRRNYIRIREYKPVNSLPVYISPLDLGPKYTDKSGAGFQEYCKTFGENYCLWQLIFCYNQPNAESDCSIARASRDCLSLPDNDSSYAEISEPSWPLVYGPKAVKCMLSRVDVSNTKDGKAQMKDEIGEGTEVEVSSDEDGFQGSWFAAIVVQVLGKVKFVVQYKCLKTDDGKEFLTEEIDA
ncbi:histone-lysine N-methyltransferase ATXR3-like [Rosa rugosa]|uniref:histone-lysine N-methyltransferase ATXR3-like n=1 Tax=Rosa rugosa TaxID=74645 RepID=UPI002B40E949|nr:histone-lysine N-methyltransferase ATXR3-like [Rosa rugosa]